MTLGMLCRADDRGLSTLSQIMVRCLRPERVLVVDMGTHSPTPCRTDVLADRWATVAYDDLLAGAYRWDAFLDGLTTVLTFETPYDYGLFVAADKRGVRSVLMPMPELDPYVRDPHLPRPDVVALPTGWLADRYPPGTPVLPVPSVVLEPEPGSLVVHPSSLAFKDRNGTRIVEHASRCCKRRIVVRGHGSNPVEQTADLYADAALVVLPRRYGGLSLTVQEAMSAGLPVLVGEHDPYAEWLPFAVPSTRGRDVACKGGMVPAFNVDPRVLADAVDLVMGHDGYRAEMAFASRQWAAENSWPRVAAQWQDVLGVTVPLT